MNSSVLLPPGPHTGYPPVNYNSTDNNNYNNESSSQHLSAEDVRSEMSDVPFAPRTTVNQTFIHLLKGYIGPGCLSLPWAVSQVGHVGGTIAIAIMSLWSSYNCWTIVKIKRYIEKSNLPALKLNELETKSEVSSAASSALTYPDVGEWAYGDRFEQFISACICTQQLAICTVFFSFVGENIYAVCKLMPDIMPSIFLNHVGVMTVALPFIMGLSFIPNLEALTPVMVTGTFLLFSGFGVLGYIIFAVWEDRPADPIEFNLRSAPLALCAILYSYEGICLILPIESAMEEPRKFKKVFWSAMTCVATILAVVSNICVYAFGTVTNGSVTAFLLEAYRGDKYITVCLMIANTAVSLSVLFTYPLQLFPTIELVGPKIMAAWRRFKPGGNPDEDEENDLTGFDPLPPLPENDVARLSKYNELHIYDNYDDKSEDESTNDGEEERKSDLGTNRSVISNITEMLPKMSIPGDSIPLRIMLVLATYCIAVVVPNVQALISLAGAIAGSSSALLIPPILELALIKHLEMTDSTSASPKPTPYQFVPEQSFLTRMCDYKISGKYWGKKLKCYFLFWIGFVFMLIGAYASINDILSVLLSAKF